MKHLLIDFENVQPQNLDKLPDEDTHIWLFLGVQHKMLPIGLVQSLLRFGKRAHLVQLQKTGKNALDFYLSYYLGQITANDPAAQIGILSRDGGYDVLIEHILDNTHAQAIVRLADIDEVQHRPISPVPNNAAATETLPIHGPSENTPAPQHSLTPYFQVALTALRQPDAHRPSRLHNLQQNLQKYVLRDLFADKTDAECEATATAVINKLKRLNLINIDEHETVSYHLSDTDLLAKIQGYIMNLRPKTYAEFQTAVQNRAAALCLSIDTGSMQAFARHLREQNLIRQENGKIEYAPFAQAKPQPAPKRPEQNIWQPDETMWKKVMAALSVSKNKRPSKVSALHNTIKAHAKCGEAEISKFVQHLQAIKFLQLNGTKIVYLK